VQEAEEQNFKKQFILDCFHLAAYYTVFIFMCDIVEICKKSWDANFQTCRSPPKMKEIFKSGSQHCLGNKSKYFSQCLKRRFFWRQSDMTKCAIRPICFSRHNDLPPCVAKTHRSTLRARVTTKSPAPFQCNGQAFGTRCLLLTSLPAAFCGEVCSQQAWGCAAEPLSVVRRDARGAADVDTSVWLHAGPLAAQAPSPAAAAIKMRPPSAVTHPGQLRDRELGVKSRRGPCLPLPTCDSRGLAPSALGFVLPSVAHDSYCRFLYLFAPRQEEQPPVGSRRTWCVARQPAATRHDVRLGMPPAMWHGDGEGSLVNATRQPARAHLCRCTCVCTHSCSVVPTVASYGPEIPFPQSLHPVQILGLLAGSSDEMQMGGMFSIVPRAERSPAANDGSAGSGLLNWASCLSVRVFLFGMLSPEACFSPVI